MVIVDRCEITHTDITTGVPKHISEVHQFDRYVVFWHQGVPVGHLYVRRNEYPNETEVSKISTLVSILKTQSVSIKREVTAWTSNSADSLKELTDDLLKGDAKTKPTVSVVICTRNRSKQLFRLLNSLKVQTEQPFEIIVVDNAPDDETTRLLVESFEGTRYILEPRPGLDIARNAGAVSAKGTVVAYLDDDVTTHPDWSMTIKRQFEDGNIDAVTGIILPLTLETKSQNLFETYWSFNKGFQDVVYSRDFLSSKYPRVWEIGAGANMAFRKDVLREAGYFDERLDVGAAGCNGDSEMWYKILCLGYSIKYSTAPVVYHEHRLDMDALKRQLYSYMRGHTAAALFQALEGKHMYRKYVFQHLPQYYFQLIMRGFPLYNGRYASLLEELKGMFSGIIYFMKHKKKARTTNF